jgi:predicted nucleic acid-binding Zn ribbon protein
MSNCIYCGASLDSDSQFCANCGKKIKMCPRCGAVLKADSSFCARCGTRLDGQNVPFMPPQTQTSPVTIFQKEAEVIDEWEEERNKNWRYLIGGIAIVVLLIVSWLGYTQFYKYTHIDVYELLDNLQLPKEYYHSAKEIVNKPDFNLDLYRNGYEYTLRGWIVYNQKYGNEIKFNNKMFNSNNDNINDYYWVIGHIMDCWNTSPAVAVYRTERNGSSDRVTLESTFYYTSNKSRGIQFVLVNDYDEKGNLEFQSVDGKYEANFKQVHL